jgi:hypothetical protein
VDLPGSDTTNGNTIQIWDCNDQKNQQWYFDGLYIRSGINDQKCIDVPGGDYTNGNKLELWGAYNSDTLNMQLRMFMKWLSLTLCNHP